MLKVTEDMSQRGIPQEDLTIELQRLGVLVAPVNEAPPTPIPAPTRQLPTQIGRISTPTGRHIVSTRLNPDPDRSFAQVVGPMAPTQFGLAPAGVG